jgi:chemotaxis protein CheY-P-specific phosphatase CheC
MDQQRLREALGKAACRVFEQTAFIFPEPADMRDGVSFDGIDFVLTELSFSGDECGRMFLMVPDEICTELSANMLGEDINDAAPKEKRFDALKEILNIIAGQVLTELYGEKAVFNLTTPEVREPSQDEFFALIDKNEYMCNVVDEHPIVTIFALKKESHEHKSIGG